MTAAYDYAGARFGRFVAETPLTMPFGDRGWSCRCDCGNQVTVATYHLKRRRACPACVRSENATKRIPSLEGFRFGSLVVLRMIRLSGRRVTWDCRCDCGAHYRVPTVRLRNGRTTACLSCARATGHEKRLRFVAGEIPKSYWDIVKHGAEERRLTLTISPADAWEVFLSQNRRCALTGEEIGFRDTSHRRHTASLDRIDSSKGYVRGNVQWVHKDINLMKNALDQEHFVYLCKKVAVHASR